MVVTTRGPFGCKWLTLLDYCASDEAVPGSSSLSPSSLYHLFHTFAGCWDGSKKMLFIMHMTWNTLRFQLLINKKEPEHFSVRHNEAATPTLSTICLSRDDHFSKVSMCATVSLKMLQFRSSRSNESRMPNHAFPLALGMRLSQVAIRSSAVMLGKPFAVWHSDVSIRFPACTLRHGITVELRKIRTEPRIPRGTSVDKSISRIPRSHLSTESAWLQPVMRKARLPWAGHEVEKVL